MAGRQASDSSQRFIDLLQWRRLLCSSPLMQRRHFSYLKVVLQKFGFSWNILQAILFLYFSPSAMTSGLLSDPFNISDGARQGCPLSPYIFALIMGPLAQSIRDNPLILDIEVGNRTHKIGFYADNVIISLTDPVNSLPQPDHTLDLFSKASLYKINTQNSAC